MIPTWLRRGWRTIALSVAGLATLTVVLIALGGGFGNRIAPAPPAAPAPLPLPFTARGSTRVEALEEASLESYPGTVRAVREALLSARIVATITEIAVRPGDRVAAGDPLVLLDRRDLDARVRQEQEALRAAQARLEEARSTAERLRAVVEQGGVSRRDLDAAEAALGSRQAESDGARQALAEARVALSHATVRAPFGAIVVDRLAEPGDLASPGVPLVRIYDPTRLRLEAFVRESQAVALSAGASVEVLLEATGARLRGVVEEIVPQADTGSRSFLVKVTLPQGGRLFPGLFGRLLLPGTPQRRLVIPARAVVEIGQLRFAILAGGRNERRMLVTGDPAGDGLVEVLSGLAEGEEILVP